MHNTVHFVLQAKGGIGKSFVSTLLAQFLINETGAVRCFDTDQENTTFAHYAALAVRHIPLTDSSRLINPKRFDTLIETLLTEDGNFVIDTGAHPVEKTEVLVNGQSADDAPPVEQLPLFRS